MKKSDFYFDLPERLIAQHPLEQRDASRLMVLDRRDGSVTHISAICWSMFSRATAWCSTIPALFRRG